MVGCPPNENAHQLRAIILAPVLALGISLKRCRRSWVALRTGTVGQEDDTGTVRFGLD
jgi:hypothetical protein